MIMDVIYLVLTNEMKLMKMQIHSLTVGGAYQKSEIQ